VQVGQAMSAQGLP